MSLATLADLFAAGAHRSIEQITHLAGFGEPMATAYLLRRYGGSLQPEPGVIRQLVDIVQGAREAGELIGEARTSLVTDLPLKEGSQPGFHYTVIATIEDATRPELLGRKIEFPLPIDSPVPLTFEQIQAIVDNTLEQLAQQGQGESAGDQDSSERRRNRALRVIRDQYGGTALPTISVISAYRS